MNFELETPVGTIGVAVTSRGVAEVSLTGPVCDVDDSADEVASSTTGDVAEIAREAERQLSEYFAGERQEFNLPLDCSLFGEDTFRARALTAMMQVGYGDVVTYGELAEMAGSPRAARAAGTACSTNPLAIIIPCHRVVPSSGGVGSYGGGEDMKRWLLAMEGSAESLKGD